MNNAKYILILLIPLIVFVLSLKITAFDDSFYKKEFQKYNVYNDLKSADDMHNSVINFITGKTNDIPYFSGREKRHLEDVRKMIGIMNAVFYLGIAMILALFLYVFKKEKKWKHELGEIIMSGGILAMVIGVVLILLILANFDAAFSMFHHLLLPPGTYTFDPSTETIVRLYPQQIFMDIGMRTAMATFIISLFLVIAGALIKKQK